ncbi:MULTISPECIES: excinuclease ABC subunit B [unclassified Salipiger]|uniref:excinuclease ABC subunit B n=1 Tax=unclassified Salipiger TaxID=2640570 RepID=UPI0013BD989D|nr:MULTISPECIES: excinuclease ABC subunit B [unclassified Salipiger]NDV53355.1 excinuclease ABC subunit B [Salipiger sp. PrR003]NDW35394.1 excinuclease ABC subunit B [Salipiger sp. PrR007]
MHRFLLISCLALAACGTPYERCNREAARFYADALQEQSRISRDLARGFTYVTEWETRRRWQLCGIYHEHPHYCWRTDTEPVTRRVPVRPYELHRRLDEIGAALPQLGRDAAAGQAECRRRFPAEVAAQTPPQG